eukprot:Nk52_evm7s2356 gene=Nk52_evmTU7s2356
MVLQHFPLPVRTPEKLFWHHAVNSTSALANALNENSVCNFIEADILRSKVSGTCIMAHPPDIESDLTFQDCFDQIFHSNINLFPLKQVGFKLDFKDQTCVVECLKIINEYLNEDQTTWISPKKEVCVPSGFRMPIWFNADILRGPGGKDPAFNGEEFVTGCRSMFPGCTLSVGFTTGPPEAEGEEMYSSSMVDQMIYLIKEHNLLGSEPFTLSKNDSHVVIPVRSDLFVNSLHTLETFLQNGISLTIFGSKEDLSSARGNNTPNLSTNITAVGEFLKHYKDLIHIDVV